MISFYPPYIQSKQAAFTLTEEGRIYFNPSILNTMEEVKFLQVSINRVDNNQNALESLVEKSGANYIKKFPTGYMFIPENKIYYDNENEMNYFLLPGSLFTRGVVYKLQIRFGQENITKRSDNFWQTDKGEIINNSWLSNYEKVRYMSEWSTISIFKVLSDIEIGIQDFSYGKINQIQTSVYTFIGTVDLKTNNEDESIKSTKFDLLKDGVVIETSGIVEQPANQRAYNYHTFKTVLENGVNYRISFTVLSKSDYEKNITYDFKPVYEVIPTTYKIIEKKDVEGLNSNLLNLYSSGVRLVISDVSYKTITKPAYYIIRKTSEKSNFKDWEEIVRIKSAPGNSELMQEFFDPYVESGIKYKYAVQPIMLNTGRGLVSQEIDVCRDYCNSWLLLDNNSHLQIDFNLAINSYKKVIKEAMIETLDSKYPYFIRNGATNYRTFNLSGLINMEMDIEKKINNKVGYVGEREFRFAFENVLLNNAPKVFKSPTEEMMIVYLSNISLTPNTTLGRTIYEFSCTVTEMADFNAENLIKYDLLPSAPIGISDETRVPAIVGYISKDGYIAPNRTITGVY